MEKDNKYIDELIISYLNGKLNENELAELETWLHSDKANKRHFYEIVELWESSAAVLSEKEYGNKKQAYQRFIQKTHLRSRRLTMNFSRIAAVLVLGVLIGGSAFFGLNNYFSVPTANSTQTIEVPFGSKSKITLSDGTLVWLNAGSQLQYNVGFSAKERKVLLKGEGYFEVAHDKKTPFIVQTSDADIRVLGTKFNVKAYEDEQKIEVILAEGSVQFIPAKNTEQALFMTPRQQVILDLTTGKTELKNIGEDQMNNWTRGSLFFNETRFDEIARQLEKTYNVHFIFKNEESRAITFYGDFQDNETLDEILEIMTKTEKFNFRRIKNTIEVY